MVWAPVITASGKPLFIPRNDVIAPALAEDADCSDCCVALCDVAGALCECFDASAGPALTVNVAGFTDQTYVKPCGNPPNCTPTSRITEEIHLELPWSNFNRSYLLDYLECQNIVGESAEFNLVLALAHGCNQTLVDNLRANGILVAREWNVDCPDDGFTVTTLYETELYIREIGSSVFCVDEDGISFNLGFSTSSVSRVRSPPGDWGAWGCPAGASPAWISPSRAPTICGTITQTKAKFCADQATMTITGAEERITVDGNNCITNLNGCPNPTPATVTWTGVLTL